MKEVGVERLKLIDRIWMSGYFRMEETAAAFAALTPSADNVHVYAKDRSGTAWLYFKDDLGVAHPVGDADATHAILSATHSDSTAAAVLRGALISGQGASAKWTRLAIGSAGAFLRNDATDVMWSTLILPNAITVNQVVYGASANTYGASANLTFDGTHLTLGAGASASELRILEPSGGGASYVSFKAPALAANVDYTLPIDDGAASQVLATDGAGVLSWTTPASGGAGLEGSLMLMGG